MVHILLFPMLRILYFYISTFRSVCVVPKMAVFCSFLISCFPGMSFWYFVNDFEMVPVALIITSIAFIIYIPHTLYLLRGIYILASSQLLS